MNTKTKEAHFIYLDALRKRGTTNMFGAGPFIKAHFKVSLHSAHCILRDWMETFGDGTKTAEQRIKEIQK